MFGGGTGETNNIWTYSFAPVPNTTYRFRVHFNKMPDLLEGDNTNYISMNFQTAFILLFIRGIWVFKGPIDMLTLYENKYKQEVEKFASEQIGRRRRMIIPTVLFLYHLNKIRSKLWQYHQQYVQV